jgi:hypothetical protein
VSEESRSSDGEARPDLVAAQMVNPPPELRSSLPTLIPFEQFKNQADRVKTPTAARTTAVQTRLDVLSEF